MEEQRENETRMSLHLLKFTDALRGLPKMEAPGRKSEDSNSSQSDATK